METGFPLDPEADAGLSKVLACCAEGTTVLLDFDGTLFRNCSTEAYLDCARPAPIAALLLTLVDIVKPWRLAGPGRGPELMWRDWLRVLLITVLMPWTLLVFRRRAAAVGPRHAATDLIAAVRACPTVRPVVLTRGFGFLVRPLVRAMGLDWPVLGVPLLTAPRHRHHGKAWMARRTLGEAALTRGVAVTDDARDDADLIAAVPDSVVVTPPPGWFRPALAHAYRPFAYVTQAKHPGTRHVMTVFLGEDWLTLVLATAPWSPNPVVTAVALIFLVVSFFILYEIGYWENDREGLQRERAPSLSETQRTWSGTVDPRWAWGLALLTALPGLGLLAWMVAPAAAAGAVPWSLTSELMALASGPGPAGVATLAGALGVVWVGLLMTQRGLFRVYNRTPPWLRIAGFPLLQVTKGPLMAVALPLVTGLPGAVLLLAMVGSRWIPYVIYRLGGPRWRTPDQVIRLLLLIAGWAGLALVAGPAVLWHWVTPLILGWSLLKARREMRALARIMRDRRRGRGPRPR